MNGKAAKRIRQAYRVADSNPGSWTHPWQSPKPTIKQLKKEYYALPYHRRDMREMCMPNTVRKGHSERLKQMHRHNDECRKELPTSVQCMNELLKRPPSEWAEYLCSGGTYFVDQYGNKRRGEQIYPNQESDNGTR